MDDVARRAGVSRALVSMTLSGSGKVSAASRAAVLRAADELGYRPNLVASHLASKRTRTLGLLINDLHNPHHAGVTDGIWRSAEQHAYRLLMTSAFLSESTEEVALKSFIDYRVAGIIEIGARMPKRIIEAAARSVPIVVIGRPMRSTNVDTVNNDDRRGAELATEHLLELGHRSIGHIDGGRGAGAAHRRRGYRAAMERRALTPVVVRGAYTEASGAHAMRQMLELEPSVTAVFAANDLSAVGALDVIGDAGLSVPGDISVVGYDNTNLAALRLVALTTIDQRREELGDLAVNALLDRIQARRTSVVHRVITPSLVVRGTTGTPLPDR